MELEESQSAEDGPDAAAGMVIGSVTRLQLVDELLAETVLPPLSTASPPWANSDSDTLRLLAAVLRALEPRHVVEFGCGASTELLAHLACEQGRMAVTCFEHDPWLAAEFVSLSGGLALNYRWFSFCICPLVARRIGDRLRPIYDDRMTTPTVPYPADLIVINGPPDVLGGRGGMIFQALKYVRPGTVALILDVRRDEAAMFDTWMSELAAYLTFVPPGFFGRHLAFVIGAPLPEAVILEEPMAQESAQRGPTHV